MKITAVYAKASMERALAFSNTLLATDLRFHYATQIIHEDGSFWFLKNAFSMEDPENDGYVWIITEHFDELVFEKDEVVVTEWKNRLDFSDILKP